MTHSRQSVPEQGNKFRRPDDRDFCEADYLFICRLAKELTNSLRLHCPEIQRVSSDSLKSKLITDMQGFAASLFQFPSLYDCKKAVEHRKGDKFLPSETYNYTIKENSEELSTKLITAVSAWLANSGVPPSSDLESQCRSCVNNVLAIPRLAETKFYIPTIYMISSGLGDLGTTGSASDIIFKCLTQMELQKHFKFIFEPVLKNEHFRSSWSYKGERIVPLQPSDLIVYCSGKLPKPLNAVLSGMTKRGINVHIVSKFFSMREFAKQGVVGEIDYQYEGEESWNLFEEYDAGKKAAKAMIKVTNRIGVAQ